jgi:chromosome segregation ATPase
VAKTQQERLDELNQKVEKLAITVETMRVGQSLEIDRLKDSLSDLKSDFKDLHTTLTKLTDRLVEVEKTLPALEVRINALEKGTDRFWQIAPMVISVVGVIVSLIIALSKK